MAGYSTSTPTSIIAEKYWLNFSLMYKYFMLIRKYSIENNTCMRELDEITNIIGVEFVNLGIANT